MEEIEKTAKNADEAQEKARAASQKATKAKAVAKQIVQEAKILGVKAPKDGENSD